MIPTDTYLSSLFHHLPLVSFLPKIEVEGRGGGSRKNEKLINLCELVRINEVPSSVVYFRIFYITRTLSLFIHFLIQSRLKLFFSLSLLSTTRITIRSYFCPTPSSLHLPLYLPTHPLPVLCFLDSLQVSHVK